MEAAAAAALERLEALSCPAVAPVLPLEPGEALRLLCTPSARRRALLEWLCSRVHPEFAARLDALRDGPEDARMREVLGLGARLLLCREDDAALAEGTAPPRRQLEFIGDLLDAAPPPAEESRCSALLCARFLHELLETPEGRAALSPPSPPPLPPLDACDGPRPSRSPPLSGPALEATLAATRQHLERLQAQNPELGGSAGAAPPVLAALGVAAGDLAALAAAFGASELRDPRGQGGARPPPAPCGPLAPPVCQRVRRLLQTLRTTAQLSDTAAELTKLSGGAPRRAIETRLAALRQRFGEPPQC